MAVEIPLTRGLAALVDEADAEWLSQFKWSAMPKRAAWYAVRTVYENGGKKTLYMHRAILSPPVGVQVDHINLNSLDNRRENLRLCQARENLCNRRAQSNSLTGFKGVSPSRGRFQAMIQRDGRAIFLGRFDTAEEAHAAYVAAARELHGEFMRTA